MTKVNKNLLNKVLSDLNLNSKQVVAEGMLQSLATKAGNAIGNAVRGVASGIGTAAGTVAGAAPIAAAGVANTARNVSNAAGNALQTDAAIIKGGLLFVGPNGEFVGIKGIAPGTPQGDYFTKQYGLKGYKPADANDRIKATGQKIQVHSTSNIVANLKDTTLATMKDLEKTAQTIEANVAGKQALSSQEMGGIYKQFNDKLIQGIAKAQQSVGGRQAPAPGLGGTPTPSAQPTPPPVITAGQSGLLPQQPAQIPQAGVVGSNTLNNSLGGLPNTIQTGSGQATKIKQAGSNNTAGLPGTAVPDPSLVTSPAAQQSFNAPAGKWNIQASAPPSQNPPAAKP